MKVEGTHEAEAAPQAGTPPTSQPPGDAQPTRARRAPLSEPEPAPESVPPPATTASQDVPPAGSKDSTSSGYTDRRGGTLDMAELLLMAMDSGLTVGKRASGGEQSSGYYEADWIGRLIGDYRIEEELGRGGMGTVFRATNVRVGSVVALKLLRFAPGQSAERLSRFELEARAAAELNHPNIINVFDVGQVGDLYYLAMEYIEGRPLSELIDKGPVDPQQLYRIANDLCEALEFAHEAGIVHRDLKPNNILIEPNGRGQLMDFGMARRNEDNGARKITEVGSIMGTAHYMSPEQAQGRSHLADSRSDIFALGCVLYEMATGQIAFTGKSPLEVIRSVAEDDPRPPRKLNSSIDHDLEIIILKAMEKMPARRYSSVKALQQDLWRWHTDEPIHARPPSMLYRGGKLLRKYRNECLAATVLVVAAASMSVWLPVHDRRVIADHKKGAAEQKDAEWKEATRRTLLEWEADELMQPDRECWRLIHAQRLQGRYDAALAVLNRHAETLSANQDGLEAHVLLWRGILVKEWRMRSLDAAVPGDGIGELREAVRLSEAAQVPAVAAAARMYLSDEDVARQDQMEDEVRAFYYYHHGHAARLRGDHSQAKADFREAVKASHKSLESQCALVELRQLESETTAPTEPAGE